MDLHVACGSLVRSSSGTGDWTVWVLEQPAGVARIERHPALTEVVVADAPATCESPTGFTAVACTPDGRAMVLTREAPPALLVAASGCRTAPAGPDGRELFSLGPDELLVVLSSSVLEARPAALSQALRSPAHLIDDDPARLLGELFAEVAHGAGAILRRTSHPSEIEEPHR